MASVANVRSAFEEMNLQELDAARALIAEIESKREQEIKNVYGEDLTRIVGYRVIDAIAKVKAEEVGLANQGSYIEGMKPHVLGGRSTARGLMEPGRAFIALKVDLLDPETKELVATVVEVVHQRFCGNMADNYVAATYVNDDQGKRYHNGLYTCQGMSQKEMEAVRDLLQGKEVVALFPHISNKDPFLMRLARNLH